MGQGANEALTEAEENFVEHAQLGETEEKDAAREHEGVFSRFSFCLRSLTLAALQKRKACRTERLVDVFVRKHGVNVFPSLRILEAQHETTIVIRLTLFELVANPVHAIFEAHVYFGSN